jgi:hypothetical protein
MWQKANVWPQCQLLAEEDEAAIQAKYTTDHDL